ncbi:MAG: hypothetical protein DRN53_06180 [Thermoprotei archaeon]|nr:MAG: hypothetical protein DRN53_06180 [Thermoprotei archaeon]
MGGNPSEKIIDEVAKKILKSLAEAKETLTCKDISGKTGIDVRRVAAKVRWLQEYGYVRRVERGKYEILNKGREVIS